MGSRTKGKRNEAVYAKYVEWTKIPRTERHRIEGCPTTKEEFASKWNVNRATLWRYEQEPDFKRAVADEALGFLEASELTAIIEGIKLDAVDRSLRPSDRYKAAELLVKWSGLIGDDAVGVKKPNDDEDSAFMSGLSDEELEALIPDDWGDDA